MTSAPPFIIGLTGSIGMGKSTTAQMFADEGIPVWDADACVHRLYEKGGLAVPPLAAVRPQAILDGAVDRGALKEWISLDNRALGQIETIVHPLVAQDRQQFVTDTKAPIILLDIPLLLEGKNRDSFDMVVVVSVDPDTQRKRVLERAGMTEEQFERILAKQMPDAEKRKLADHIIETRSLDEARASVKSIVGEIRETLANA